LKLSKKLPGGIL